MCQKPYILAGPCSGTGRGVPAPERSDVPAGCAGAGDAAAGQGRAHLHDPLGRQYT